MAAAIMHQQGKFDPEAGKDMVESKPPDAKDWIREQDVEQKKGHNLKGFFDPHNVTAPMVPGQDLPDRERGGTARRRVKGI